MHNNTHALTLHILWNLYFTSIIDEIRQHKLRQKLVSILIDTHSQVIPTMVCYDSTYVIGN